MTDPLYVREEDPLVLVGTLDAAGDLQMLHGSDSLATYDQQLYAEHSDLDQAGGVIRFKLMDFTSGGYSWQITAVHSGTVTWSRGTDHAYYDFGPLTSWLPIDITATSNASPPQAKPRTLSIKTAPLDAQPERPLMPDWTSHSALVDPDLELLQQWRAGDAEAGGKLLAQYFNNLRVFFIQRVPQEDPEDLIQEVFRRMVEARDRFEGRSTLRTYLFHIAGNVYFEVLRKRSRPGRTFDPLTESSAVASGRSQSSLLAENERQQLLLDALRNIPGDQQDVIELYHFHGFTTAQLAEHLRIPHGTAKTRLKSARQRLAEAFLELFKVGELSDEQLVQDLTLVREAVWRGQLPGPK